MVTISTRLPHKDASSFQHAADMESEAKTESHMQSDFFARESITFKKIVVKPCFQGKRRGYLLTMSGPKKLSSPSGPQLSTEMPASRI